MEPIPQPPRNAFGYASHFPILAAMLIRTEGRVLELGAGEGSTPLIHYMTQGAFPIRHALTVDTDPKWLDEFKGYQSETHQFRTVENSIKGWMEYLNSLVCKYSVAFVDLAPGDARIPMILGLHGQATYIVAHDTEADIPPGGGAYGWAKLDGVFRHQLTFKRFRPWTTIYSDLPIPLKLEDCDC